jgi:hypothetical protein
VIKTVEPQHVGHGVYIHGKQIDGRYFYTAGKVWLSGQSPYHFDTFISFWKKNNNLEDSQYYWELKEGRGTFIYPPTMGIFSIPLSPNGSDSF